jgi:hypothetical protein
MSKEKVFAKIDDFHENVINGLRLSFKKMIQTKIEKNQSVVIMRDGKIVTVKASELDKI